MTYICPICGMEIDENTYVYLDRAGDVFGCEHCIKETFADKALKSEEEEEENRQSLWDEDSGRLEREERMY